MKFELFANVIPVKGFMRSILMDLQRGTFHFIPNEIEALLQNECRQAMFSELIYTLPESEAIQEYINFFIDQQLGHYIEAEASPYFTALPLQWDFPAAITNAIIEVSEYTLPYLKDILVQLNELGTEYFECRITGTVPDPDFISEVARIISKSGELKAHLLFNAPDVPLSFYHALVDTAPQISEIKLFNTAPLEDRPLRYGGRITRNSLILDNSFCGFIDPAFFRVDMHFFTESQQHNTCLNRKLCIDREGQYKNCLSLPQSFGNISSGTSIQEVLRNESFLAKFYVHKDLIKVCRDCEFRHMCSDCRAYTEDIDDALSKPLKCGYDPYTNVWQAWQERKESWATFKQYRNMGADLNRA